MPFVVSVPDRGYRHSFSSAVRVHWKFTAVLSEGTTMLKRMGLVFAAALLAVGLSAAPAGAAGHNPDDHPCAVCW
jgi:hypothetical protein